MPIPKLRLTSALVALVAVVTSLTACGAAGPAAITNPPTMAPDQSVAEACSLSRAEVDSVTQEVKDRLDQAGKDIAAGKTPDLSGIFESIGGTLDQASAKVTNPDVLAALDGLHAELNGIGEIQVPESLLDAPGYLSEITSQFGKVQSAGEELQQLCTES